MAAPGIKMKDYMQARVNRMNIISELYKRGWSYRQMRDEVIARLDLKGYSLRTVHKDVHALLEEWRTTRLENMDHAMQLELERIDDVVREAWEAWDKSKEDFERRKAKQFGRLPSSASGEDADEGGVMTMRMEQERTEMRAYGDPRLLDVINRSLAERRKLLGLYSPDKREISGGMTFANLLMETGIVDDEE